MSAEIDMINYENNPLGDVTHNGNIIHLTQPAWATGTDEDPLYVAHGVDDAGNEYQVEWETLLEWDAKLNAYQNDPKENPDPPPEERACDWHEYTVTAL